MTGQADFWKQDTFAIQRAPGPHAAPVHVPKPHDIPDERELFTIQRQLNQALGAMDEKTDRSVREYVEKAYKTTNRYLKKYVNPTGTGGL